MSTTENPRPGGEDHSLATTPGTSAAPAPTAPVGEPANRFSSAWREIVGGSWGVSVGAVILALLAGAVMIAGTDETVRQTATYFFSKPGDMLAAVWGSVRDA